MTKQPMTKQPATPLPWHQPSRYSPEDGCDIPCGAIEGANGESVAVGTYAQLPTHCAQNAAYIAHSANAYPRLVEMLRTFRHWEEVAALLREIGEEA